MPFASREQAADLLAQRLKTVDCLDPIVIALPRGGVPIGAKISHELKTRLEILVVRKIGAPGNAEYGIGAVTEHGYFWIDPALVRAVHATFEEVERAVATESLEVERRLKLYRNGRHRYRIRGRTALLVDDGLATGVTARVAARYLKEQGAVKVILAVPVSSSRGSQGLRPEVDEIICLDMPEEFTSVGQFYEDFSQVSDQQVIETLAHARPTRAFELLGLSEEVELTVGDLKLSGHLTIPSQAKGIVIFAHGSGSSRLSLRNQEVARFFNQGGLGTLLFDLLTPSELIDRSLSFDISLLAHRLVAATRWLRGRAVTRHFPLAYFGSSSGAGAALWAAAELGHQISAIVSRGGRPDLASPRLGEVKAPTLLVVGANDPKILELNKTAMAHLMECELCVVPGASHLFEEPGALDFVSSHALPWVLKQLTGEGPTLLKHSA